MDVLSVSSLPATSLVWQPRPSSWVLTVISKATFTLKPGEATFAPEQEAPNEHDNHWDDDSDRSLIAASDLVPIKPRAEVMLVGQAFAPNRQPSRSVVVRLSVGEVDKAIEVSCDRTVGPDNIIQPGSPFLRMSLRYERAVGGPGTWNPVGVRPDARDSYGRRVLPNLRPFRKGDDEPAGFGPIASTWPSRVERLGRAGELPLDAIRERPLPEGMDYEFFNQAPRDQQLAQLRENERITLENLHPEHARLVTSLPGFRPAAFIDRGKGPGQRLSLRADTLWIDTDRGIATLVWRGQVSLEHKDEKGRVIVGLDAPGGEATWAQVERLAGPASGRAGNRRQMTSMTMVQPEDRPTNLHTALPSAIEAAMAALPFTGARPGNNPDPATERPPPNPGAGLPFAPGGSTGPLPSAPPAAAASVFPRGPGIGAPWSPPSPTQALGPGSLPPMPPPPPIAAAPKPPPLPPAALAPKPPPIAPPAMAVSGIMAPPMPPPPISPAALETSSAAIASPWVSGGKPPIDSASKWGIAAPPAVIDPATAARSADAGGTAMAASNAAAAAAAAYSVPRRDVRAPLKVLPDLEPEPAQATKRAMRLVWMDPEVMPRVRRIPRYKPILAALEDQPLERDRDDPSAEQDPMAAEDRREMFEIIARGETTDGDGVDEALDAAVREDGKFVPPLVLLAGELDFPFDELEALKATITAATPEATQADEDLRATLEIGRRFLRTPGLSASPQVSVNLTNRIRDAFAKEKPTTGAEFLDLQTERVLLKERHYQKRELLGDDHLRFLFHVSGSKDPLIGYLPMKVASKLPMFKRFKGRLLAEAHLVEDQYDTQPSCLRVVGLVRVAEMTRRA